MANEFEDFGSMLAEETQALEAEENEAAAKALGKGAEDDQAPTPPKESEDEESEDLEDGSEDKVDPTYDSLLEFPDLSQEDTWDDENDVTADDEEAEEDSESDDEEAEDDDDEEELEAKPFDLESELDAIKDLKTSHLRKTYLENKARLTKAEEQVAEYKRKAEASEKEVDRARQEYLDKISTPDLPPVEETEEYKTAVSDYVDWRKRIIRRKLKSGELRDKVARNENTLRAQAAEIQQMDGAEYDAAYKEWRKNLERDYGDNADVVEDVALEAAEFEIRAMEIRSNHEKTRQESAVAYAQERFDSTQKDVTKSILGAFSLSEEAQKKNPLAFAAWMTRILNDPNGGEKALELVKGDIEAAQLALHGPPPPDLSKYLNDADRQEAQKLYLEEVQTAESQRENDIPLLIASGMAAHRWMPILLKKISEQEELLKGKRPAPVPNKKTRKAGKKKKAEDVDAMGAEVDSLIAGLEV